jgi:hypothetical protein
MPVQNVGPMPEPVDPRNAKRPIPAARTLQSPRRRALLAAGVGALLAGACSAPGSDSPQSLAQGIVWQPDADHLNPQGNWDRLGVTDLLVQWTAVDGTSFLPVADTTSGLQPSSPLPDWTGIAQAPWARNVIVGLAGYFDETAARTNLAQLAEWSLQLVAAQPPVHVAGYYFPVEIDPTWQGVSALAPLLDELPRPLWVSAYDNSNIGGPALAAFLDGCLPRDVGVFFQDGCGASARAPDAARGYADALAARLGGNRVRIIAEAFRPAPSGSGFRAATAAELLPQLLAYRNYKTWIFDGPHYVSNQLVQDLLNAEGQG